jgi:hypothetical protein
VGPREAGLTAAATTAVALIRRERYIIFVALDHPHEALERGLHTGVGTGEGCDDGGRATNTISGLSQVR